MTELKMVARYLDSPSTHSYCHNVTFFLDIKLIPLLKIIIVIIWTCVTLSFHKISLEEKTLLGKFA
jgi:hypothetical protein